MTFDDARSFVMPWGKFRGKTLHELWQSGQGLDYLCWLDSEIKTGIVRIAMDAFLADPSIKAHLAKVREDKYWAAKMWR